jgi:hypothetical protein
MYAFVVLASWRVLQEIFHLAGKTWPLYLVVALMASWPCSIREKPEENWFKTMASA